MFSYINENITGTYNNSSSSTNIAVVVLYIILHRIAYTGVNQETRRKIHTIN